MGANQFFVAFAQDDVTLQVCDQQDLGFFGFRHILQHENSIIQHLT